jgi:predicted AAA+ superfamily ATPase
MLITGKVLVLYGPRQVGKTTLANDLIASVALRSRFNKMYWPIKKTTYIAKN